MPTRFLTWEMLIIPGSFGADNRFLSCPGFVFFMYLFFNLSGRVHILHAGGACESMWNQALRMEQPSKEHVCLGLAEVKAHAGGRWRKLRRRRRAPQRADRASGPNVSAHVCATIVLPMLQCREGAGLLNEEPCKFQLSTCDQSFGQRERLSPYPYLISGHSYTFSLSSSADHAVSLGRPWSPLPSQTASTGSVPGLWSVWTAIQVHEVKIFFSGNNARVIVMATVTSISEGVDWLLFHLFHCDRPTLSLKKNSPKQILIHSMAFLIAKHVNGVITMSI